MFIHREERAGRFESGVAVSIVLTLASALLLAVSFQSSGSRASHSGSKPKTTTSWYQDVVGTGLFYSKGCNVANEVDQGDQPKQGFVIMSFGSPVKLGTDSWGASAFDNASVTTGEIRDAMETWGKGFFDCLNTGNRPETDYRIAPGVTNKYPTEWSTVQASNHGDQWARMVSNIRDYFEAQGYAGDVTARGAVDIEIGWAGAILSRHWADGYQGVSGRPGYVNFGDAAGCEDFDAEGYAACGGPDDNWDSTDVHYVSSKIPVALPLPQIYREDGVQAEQWVMISKYGYDTGNGILPFQAPLTQDQACDQVGGCSTTHNIPLDAWNQMDGKMDAKPNTKVQMYFSTDIKWQNP